LVEEQRAMQRMQFEVSMAQAAQQFDLAERSFKLAEKQASVAAKPSKGKKGGNGGGGGKVSKPAMPKSTISVQPFDPASLTPTFLAGMLTANGKTGSGSRSSALSGSKARPTGLGKRSNTGTAARPGMKRSKAN
jgi:hypothetical protein